jgi:hypothetical protein
VRTGNSNAGARYPGARPQRFARGTDHAELGQLDAPVSYPAGRRAEGNPPGFTTERYYRFESTGAEVTLGDTDTDVKVFSGPPDKIVLHARSGGALVTVTDILGLETDEVIVHQDDRVEVFLPRRVIKARNLVAGSNTAFYAEAFYAGPVQSADVR